MLDYYEVSKYCVYVLAGYTLDNKYEDKEYKVDDGGDVTFADNPEYGTTKLHIYDEVRHRPGPNPYEDVTLGMLCMFHSTLYLQ